MTRHNHSDRTSSHSSRSPQHGFERMRGPAAVKVQSAHDVLRKLISDAKREQRQYLDGRSDHQTKQVNEGRAFDHIESMNSRKIRLLAELKGKIERGALIIPAIVARVVSDIDALNDAYESNVHPFGQTTVFRSMAEMNRRDDERRREQSERAQVIPRLAEMINGVRQAC